MNAREECADVAGRDRGDGAQLVLAQVAQRAQVGEARGRAVGRADAELAREREREAREPAAVEERPEPARVLVARHDGAFAPASPTRLRARLSDASAGAPPGAHSASASARAPASLTRFAESPSARRREPLRRPSASAAAPASPIALPPSPSVSSRPVARASAAAPASETSLSVMYSVASALVGLASSAAARTSAPASRTWLCQRSTRSSPAESAPASAVASASVTLARRSASSRSDGGAAASADASAGIERTAWSSSRSQSDGIELENHESVGSTSHTRPRAACASTTTHTAAFLEGIRMVNEEDLKLGACSLSQFECADAVYTSNMRTATAVLALLATARAETLVVTSDDGTASWAVASYSAMSAEVGDVISLSYMYNNESKPST